MPRPPTQNQAHPILVIQLPSKLLGIFAIFLPVPILPTYQDPISYLYGVIIITLAIVSVVTVNKGPSEICVYCPPSKIMSNHIAITTILRMT